MKKPKPSLFIVVFYDGNCLHIPMTWDADCDGALCCSSIEEAAAVFHNRADAKKAIRVSTAFAKLSKEQGKTVNEDFISCLKHIHIQPLSSAP
mgnify:CR=1 FL=1